MSPIDSRLSPKSRCITSAPFLLVSQKSVPQSRASNAGMEEDLSITSALHLAMFSN